MKTLNLFLLVVVTVVCAAAQAPRFKFDEASIKQSFSGSGSSTNSKLSEGTYTSTNVTLLQLLMSAYDMQDFQIIGRSAWVDTLKYDIEGKAANTSMWQPMLQALLADHFKLSVHKESQELPLYNLVIADRGLKMKESGTGTCTDNLTSPCNGFNATNVSVAGRRISMTQLVSRLSRSLGRAVIDKTALQDRYDVQLEWTIPQNYKSPANVDASENISGSIFRAIEEQLGLKLEPAKGPVDVLVIDHAERPNSN